VPFSDPAVPNERLVLVIQIKEEELEKFAGPLSIGVEVINEGEPPAGTTVVPRPRLLASLEDENGSRPLRILAETTGGLLTSGAIVLDINRPPNTSGTFAIGLRSASGGFLRSPRLQRMSLNVLAVGQSRLVENEEGALRAAVPNQVHELKQPGLMFPVTNGTFKVEVFENGAWEPWTAVADLGASGSADRHFELDVATATIRFGNGINGHLPQIESPIRVTYSVCDGARGNLARNIRWSVDGVSGEFGVNSEVMEGGSDARGLPDLRALARGRFRQSHPIVTSADLEAAALSFADLGVERAREIPPRQSSGSVRGSRSLVVVGHHEGTSDTATEAEAPELLAEIRSRLAPRLPAGQRLEVSGPRYVTVRVVATMRAVRNAKPKTVADAAVTALRTKLAVVAPPGQSEWPFGRDLTHTMVKGWLRAVEGVARVLKVELRATGRETTDVVKLGPRELPHYQFEPGDLMVEREPLGGAR
jgi:predicted phage baseplate assembly protein